MYKIDIKDENKTVIFDGIHGKVIMFETPQKIGAHRHDKAELKSLLKIKEFRWLETSEFDTSRLSIGF